LHIRVIQNDRSLSQIALTLLSLSALTALAATPPLTVVQDLGGASALPYYHALNLQPDAGGQSQAHPMPNPPLAPTDRHSEADLLPVRSVRLRPGRVTPRVIRASGLTPIFLIGDDARSRSWLLQRIDTLRALNAVGFVVNVESEERLQSLRQLAQGLTLAPTTGDDLAQRLDLRHYPVLITATGIEQ
jgi:integrating conjugative element protein (TIGR03765 family)